MHTDVESLVDCGTVCSAALSNVKMIIIKGIKEETPVK